MMKRNSRARLAAIIVYLSIWTVSGVASYQKHHPKQLQGSFHFLPGDVRTNPKIHTYEVSEPLNEDGVPNHLHVSGELWTISKVQIFEDALTRKPGENFHGRTAQTNCDRREIDYIDAPDPTELRASLMHEVFHAGACLHGGARWWNSHSDKENDHKGIYHLGEFWAQFVRDNPVFMRWAGQGGE